MPFLSRTLNQQSCATLSATTDWPGAAVTAALAPSAADAAGCCAPCAGCAAATGADADNAAAALATTGAAPAAGTLAAAVSPADAPPSDCVADAASAPACMTVPDTAALAGRSDAAPSCCACAADAASPALLDLKRASQFDESPPVRHIAAATSATTTAATAHSHGRPRDAPPSGIDTLPRGRSVPADAGIDRSTSGTPFSRRSACANGSGSTPSIFA
ncbi:Uncharacterised protein [Burkholderia pseudomallei]|nr:Uncharacterised protein [Burkholderia pseudomallei]